MPTTSPTSSSPLPIPPIALERDPARIPDQAPSPVMEPNVSDSSLSLNSVLKAVSTFVSTAFPPLAPVVALFNGIFGSGK
jgi:hypothetical protein